MKKIADYLPLRIYLLFIIVTVCFLTLGFIQAVSARAESAEDANSVTEQAPTSNGNDALTGVGLVVVGGAGAATIGYGKYKKKRKTEDKQSVTLEKKREDIGKDQF